MCGKDFSGVAEPAQADARFFEPIDNAAVFFRLAEMFERFDVPIVRERDRQQTGGNGLAVKQDGTGAATALNAAGFYGQVSVFTQHVEQLFIGSRLKERLFAIHDYRYGHFSPSVLSERAESASFAAAERAAAAASSAKR